MYVCRYEEDGKVVEFVGVKRLLEIQGGGLHDDLQFRD